MSEFRAPFLIPATYHEKVWGRPRDNLRLGEIWCRAHPLLLKFIFTSEKLSVQVHPGDDYALPREKSLGKTECWVITGAEPGARLAVGLRRDMTREQLTASIQDGSIEQQLCWLDVHPGDFIFVPWGTVHAIGPGITLCEIQEFSDITYRMYDYGRPRELHLEKALEVIRRHPSAGRLEPARLAEGGAHDFLVVCRHFAIERRISEAAVEDRAGGSGFDVVVFIEGEGNIVAGNSVSHYVAEQMWQVPREAGAYRIEPARSTTWLKVYVPGSLDRVRALLDRAGVPEQDRRRVVVEDV